MKTLPYDRISAVNYAKKWAFARNPEYFDFSFLGGDCTNFVSQCVYAGSGIMNYEPVYGWYYISSYDRSPAWTGVEFFYDFFINNKGPGPFATETDETNLLPGDVVQFKGRDSFRFDHTLSVTGIIPSIKPIILVSAHTDNAYMRPLNTYRFRDIRFLHIEGVRKEE